MKSADHDIGANLLSKNLAILAGLILVSRIPFLFLGYGSDGDAWRVAFNSFKIWETGVYSISRFPGFPLYELLITPFIIYGGSILANLVTVIVFMVAVYTFDRLLVVCQKESRDILLWTFAFTPILWKNSVTTLDYVWGMSLILISYLLFLKNKRYTAAILIGLASAARLTNIIFVVPFFFLLDSENRVKNIFTIAAISLIVAAICYLPVILRSEAIKDLKIYIADIRHYSFLKQTSFFVYRSIYSIGLLAFIVILYSGFRYRIRIIELFRLKEKVFYSLLSGIVLMLIVFFILPDEREYLIPAIPFLLLLIGIVFPRKYVITISICLWSYSLINIDIIEHNFQNQKPHLSFTSGYVIKDYNERSKILEWREAILTYPFKDSSIIMLGVGPVFSFENRFVKQTQNASKLLPDRDSSDQIDITRIYPDKNTSQLYPKDIYFVYALSEQESKDLKNLGYTLYYQKAKKEYIESCTHYDLDRYASPF